MQTRINPQGFSNASMSEWKPQGRGLRGSRDGEGREMRGWGMEGGEEEDAMYPFSSLGLWTFGGLQRERGALKGRKWPFSKPSLKSRDPGGMIPGL